MNAYNTLIARMTVYDRPVTAWSSNFLLYGPYNYGPYYRIDERKIRPRVRIRYGTEP